MQRTCNTRATHVQHNVQHEHFHCKFTGKIAFSRPPATKLLCFHLKAKVGLQRQKKHNVTCKFTVKVLVLHVVLHVCCTCVARVLHVCCTCVAWEFTGKSMIAGQWCPRAGISPPWLPNLHFAKQTKAISYVVSRMCD